MEKIGKLSYDKFETEFFVVEKVKEYLEKENLSLATLIPSAYHFYEQILFDSLDDEWKGKPEKKFGRKFSVIFNGITESRGWSTEKGLETSGFNEKIDDEENNLFYSAINLTSLKNPDKKFVANYFVIKNDKQNK